MDIKAVKSAIKAVIAGHRPTIRAIGASQTKLMELGATAGVAKHYQANGCTAVVQHPGQKRGFALKCTTRGAPWNFSYFTFHLKSLTFELHVNLPVRGAHDDGIYCVDVAIVEAGSVLSCRPNFVC